MPAKWQQWMPFKIDAFRGSPAVQAMHPAARSGYLYLLSTQWQTDDCAIESDPISLADASGLGDELWALHGPRILRNFTVLDDGRLRNAVCYEEWLKAKAVFEKNDAHRQEVSRKRAEAARIANEKRWGHKTPDLGENGSQTDPKPVAHANLLRLDLSQNDPLTGTGTGTGTKEHKNTIARQDVERVYEAYPRKVGKEAALKAIEKALKRIQPRDVEWLIERVRGYADLRQHEDPQFTPHPATWFNQGRYDDETLEPKQKPIWTDLSGEPIQ